MRIPLCCLLLGSLLFSGCSRKNPVQEVSVSDSGVALADPSTGVLSDSDWNQWRGPNVNGVAPDQNVVTTWSDDTNVLWRSDVPGRGHGSPIVVGDSVYLATAIEQEDKQQVVSFDRSSGKERWATVIHDDGLPSKRAIHQKATNANGTIACDGQRLYIGMLNSDAIFATALTLEGQMVWQQEVGKFVSKFGYAPSPVLYKSLVIFAADNMGGGYITAVDGETGSIAWRIARNDDSSYSSPTVANVGGRDQLLISGGDSISSYDPASGDQLWSTPCLAASTCGTVVTDGNLIFGAGGYPRDGIICLNDQGKEQWSNNTKVYEPSMLIAGDKLIAVNDDGIGFCFESASGEVLWKKRLGGNFSASPLLCDNKVFVPNLNGDTFVLEPSEEYKQISKNRLGNDCYASPAVSKGQLFLRIGIGKERDRKEQLVCIGQPAEDTPETGEAEEPK